ncbi:3-hydroxybenzoate 6-monooxygenase [Saccharothrix syringae]|uniref:3-hydroxybenzoate 6-monooxygenase n=1 Tax=Saccharothrix syringae TaxID=103733 RepID=A0A5Q0H1G3_SACSY|nr:3-hydroxybenzoate 6-monooxygenase [Saccharothrix syringae]QFZ19620.1 3-hydroxybenzoate 6-monooxygenase [Saccharothrix syringae]
MARFVVVGGGIGGLAAALSVARAGHEVEVLERAREFAELGAGIQLAPNAFHALDVLGVGAEVRAAAVHVEELRLVDGRSGGVLARMPVGEGYRGRFGNPYAVVHRPDLHTPLLRACRSEPAIRLRAGCAVVRYEDSGRGVTCELASGERVTGDALVGADGIRSTVRGQLLGDGEPRVTGHTIFRSVVPMDSVPPGLRWNAVCLWALPGAHLVHYPIAGGRKLNLAITRDDGARTAVSGLPADRADVLAAFTDLPATARELLELGRDWHRWVLCDRDPVPRWHEGRVVLIGDAAHPMLQYAAQGACMALEDAVVLGALVRCGPDAVPDRFGRFTALRRDRTARAQEVARWLGEAVYHAAGDRARSRDALLAGLSAEDLYEAVSWLHAAKVDAPAAAR